MTNSLRTGGSLAQEPGNGFQNIGAKMASDAVETLLDRYILDDPAAGNEVGVFTNPDIQGLYNDLVAKGKESLVAALSVGVTTEEMDIDDLKAVLRQAQEGGGSHRHVDG